MAVTGEKAAPARPMPATALTVTREELLNTKLPDSRDEILKKQKTKVIYYMRKALAGLMVLAHRKGDFPDGLALSDWAAAGPLRVGYEKYMDGVPDVLHGFTGSAVLNVYAAMVDDGKVNKGLQAEFLMTQLKVPEGSPGSIAGVRANYTSGIVALNHLIPLKEEAAAAAK